MVLPSKRIFFDQLPNQRKREFVQGEQSEHVGSVLLRGPEALKGPQEFEPTYIGSTYFGGTKGSSQETKRHGSVWGHSFAENKEVR